MNRAFCSLRKRFQILAAGMLLLHLSITGTIFVRCLPSEGLSVLELIGKDPHKHGHSAGLCLQDDGALQSICAEGAEDCTDLLLDLQAVRGVERSHPLPLSNGSMPDASFAAAIDLDLLESKPPFHPFPESAPHWHRNPALRI